MDEVAQERWNRESKQGGGWGASGESDCRPAGALELEEGKVAEVRCACVGAMVLLWNWRGLGIAFKLSSELRTAVDAVVPRDKGLGIWEGQWQKIEAGGQGGSLCPA